MFFFLAIKSKMSFKHHNKFCSRFNKVYLLESKHWTNWGCAVTAQIILAQPTLKNRTKPYKNPYNLTWPHPNYTALEHEPSGIKLIIIDICKLINSLSLFDERVLCTHIYGVTLYLHDETSALKNVAHVNGMSGNSVADIEVFLL